MARMLITNPKEFNTVARAWAEKYAGAPAQITGGENHPIDDDELERQEERRQEREEAEKTAECVYRRGLQPTLTNVNRYRGYNKALIDRFAAMGFDVPTVVAAFEYVGVETSEGEDQELDEEYMGDITARLFHEQ